MLFLQRCFDQSFFRLQRCGAWAFNSFHGRVVGNAECVWRRWGHWSWYFFIDANSFLWHPDEPYLQKLEIGTQMSLPVEVKPVWWCITSQLQTLVWEGHTFINGTMIDATWSTILSANTPQVGETTVIFQRWDIVLEKQLPPGLWGNLQVSFGLWFWFLWCVPEPTLTGDVICQ